MLKRNVSLGADKDSLLYEDTKNNSVGKKKNVLPNSHLTPGEIEKAAAYAASKSKKR